MVTDTQSNDLYSRSLGTDAGAEERVVLVVDDDVSTRRLIRTLLTRMTSAIVFDAADAASATCIALTLRRPVDLLVSDIDLGGMDGIQLASELSRLAPEMKVLLISGDASRQCGLRGEWKFLAKPFAIARLIEFVEAALR